MVYEKISCSSTTISAQTSGVLFNEEGRIEHARFASLVSVIGLGILAFSFIYKDKPDQQNDLFLTAILSFMGFSMMLYQDWYKTGGDDSAISQKAVDGM